MVMPAVQRTTASGKDAIAVVVENGTTSNNTIAGIRTNGGIYAAVVTDNVDQVIAIPAKATSAVVYFSTSASDDSFITGRIAFGDSTLITSITATDTKLGHQPAMPIQHAVPTGVTHLHFTGKAGNVLKGFWITNP